MTMSVSDRITADLRQRILSGALKPGDILPTVEVFQAEYAAYGREGKISAMPVRQALDRLRSEGRIVFRPGIGNVVTDQPT